MKKRLFSLLLLLLFVFSLTSCAPKPLPSKEVSSFALKEEEACFNFFWETQVTDESLYSYGLIPDRYPSNGLASIASVGFGLAGIPIGVQNGWITYKEGEERVVKTLKSMDELDTIHGFYYHFYSSPG